jgi:hypothetical protein
MTAIRLDQLAQRFADDNPAVDRLACRVYDVLGMACWRTGWREAEAAHDFAAFDRLDRAYEALQGL